MSLFRKKILPIALSFALALGTTGAVYAEEPVASEEEVMQEAAEAESAVEDTAETSAAEEPVVADPVLPVEPTMYTVHIAEGIENGNLLVAGRNEDIQAEEGTVIYLTAVPDKGYETVDVKVLNDTSEELEVVPSSAGVEDEYQFIMPASDVQVSAGFDLKEEAEEEDEKETEVADDSVMTLDLVSESATDSPALASVKNITISMIGFQSYELAGYGSGYDAAFAVAAGQYEVNANAFCLNPAVQAPGSSSQNHAITYSCNVNDYSDQMLLKIMYYGFGGGGDITTQFADNPPARHILTHMVATKRAAELGIAGAGDYTYRANATAIGLANSLYNAIKSMPDVTGTVSVLTPVAGQQTIILLSSFGEKTGKLSLTKTGANVSLTRGNPCYSLEGAEYAVYSDSDCRTKVGTFTTKADGTSTGSLTLNPGTYYVKETKAPKGYLLSEIVYPARVTTGNTTTVKAEDIPGNDPVRLIVEKKDALTGEATEALEGAEFTVKYYAVESESEINEPNATWVFKTDENGRVNLDDTHKVNGDSLFKDESTGAYVLPYGFITIQETKAPHGYKINKTVYTCRTTENNGVISTSNLPTGENAVKEQPYQPTVGTTAKSEATGTHTAVSAEEEVLIDTVAYEDLIKGTEYTLKTKLVDTSSESVLATAEKKFTPSKGSGTIDVDVTIDTTELEGKTLVFFEELYEGTVKKAEHCDPSDESQRIYVPRIRTSAVDKSTGTQAVAPETTVTVSDTVSYTGLTVGETYTITGTLMDKATGEPLTVDGNPVTAEKAFTPSEAAGTVVVEFTFDASHLIGKTLVAFESLSYEENELCVHADINDKAQTVEVSENPAIGTNAKDGSTGTNVGCISSEAVIIDTVSYSGLTKGKTYQLVGTLMERETGEEFVAGGNHYSAATQFTAEEQNGTVEVTFNFDASDLGGKSLVVFETLKDMEDKVLAEHKDLNDEFQTVTYPSIRTNAADGQTGSHAGTVGETRIVDTVSYTGLIIGKTYTVSGTLMNKSTGEPLLVDGTKVTSEVSFIAADSDGTVELVYGLDASALEGTTVVVFEDLLHSGIKVYSHADINDEDQSIHYPRIRTTATANGAKEVTEGEDITLVDTVTYKNLIAGENYTVKGVLMDKATGKELLVDGKQVTAEASFTAESTDGSVDVSFVFNTKGLGGTTTVVFETLYNNGVEVTAHADINDSDQTIVINKKPETPKTPSSSPKTGDTTTMMLYIVLFGLAFAVLTGSLFVKRREKR